MATSKKCDESFMLSLGSTIASRNNDKLLDERTYVCFYGIDHIEVLQIWEMCCTSVLKPTPKHLFWALMYMKLYLPIEVMLVLLATSKPTFNKYVWTWIDAIAKLHEKVILWENRLRNAPEGPLWCLVTVDGTDFQIGEPFPFEKQWKSPKQKGASVKYEVAVSIYSGDIVWIYGPHRGSKHDKTIFDSFLQKMLAEGEQVEADAGYAFHGVSSNPFIRSRDDFGSDEERKEKSELRARHETANRRFKSWGILKQQFRNDKRKHQFVFYAIASMTQIQINNGNVLFSCEPKTLKKECSYTL
jgi:hypothetical protein